MGEQTAFDVELQAWSKLTGASIDNTHINQDQGDFAPRQDAAVKGGSVQDMCYCTGLVSQWQQLGDITDVSDVVADIQQAYGPVEDYLKSGLFIDGKWWAIPYYSNVTATFLRKDWLDAKGGLRSRISRHSRTPAMSLWRSPIPPRTSSAGASPGTGAATAII
jgi:multiple sugar transport system substrate-binding protein